MTTTNAAGLTRLQLIRKAIIVSERVTDIVNYEGCSGNLEMKAYNKAIDSCGREDFESHSLPESVLLQMDTEDLLAYVNQGEQLLDKWDIEIEPEPFALWYDYPVGKPPEPVRIKINWKKFFIGYTLLGLICIPFALVINNTQPTTPSSAELSFTP